MGEHGDSLLEGVVGGEGVLDCVVINKCLETLNNLGGQFYGDCVVLQCTEVGISQKSIRKKG